MKWYTLIPLIFLFSSCRTQKVIEEVPVEKINTVYRNNYVHDSIYLKDSVYIYQKGDTVYDTRYFTKHHYITSTDTLVTHDSIPYIVTKTETVEVNILYWWQKMLMCLGGGVVALIILYVLRKINRI